MKKHTLILFCAAAVFALNACDSDDNSNSCNTSKDCGNTELYKCNILQHVCEARFPEHCINNQKDSGEADVDCGNICGNEKLCALNKSCTSNADCASKSCVGNKCVAATCTEDANCSAIAGAVCDVPNGVCISCTDGVQNGDETDIDCGGKCSTKCAGGKACKKGGDCENGICEAGTCSSVTVDAADPKELVINEVFDSASASPAFALNGGAKACEFIEIANPTSKVVSLDGLSLELLRTDDGKGKVLSVPLSGALPAKNLLVVHSCDTELSLPDDAVALRPNKGDEKNTALLSLTSTWTYDITLTNGSASTEKISIVIGEAKSKSSFTRDPEFSPLGEMKQTTSIAGYADFATPGYCTNGGQFSKGCIVQDTCNNSQKDGTESDVDCGGTHCAKCADAKACNGDNDCASGFCDNNVCATKTCTKDSECGTGLKCNLDEGLCYTPESCSDNLQNQDETDTDCGGSCSACALGQKCKENSDCDTNECTNGTCTGTKPDKANVNDLVINEVFDSASASPTFPLNDDIKACEFIEIANTTDKLVSLDGISISMFRSDDGKDKTFEIPLKGSLPGKNLLVVHSCEESIKSNLPDDAVELKPVSDSGKAILALVSTATYDITLTDGENSTPKFTVVIGDAKSKSSFTRDPEFSASGEMKLTTNLDKAAAFATPGYCNNCGKYSEGCVDTCSNGQKDGDESDVDCGGTKCGKCDNDKACKSENDCKSGECTAGKCTCSAPEKGDYTKMFVNEVLLAPKSSGLPFNPVQTANGCKFVEILNLDSSKSYDLDGIWLMFENLDDNGSKVNIPLSGTLMANSAFVVFMKGCSEEIDSQLPTGVNSMHTSKDPAMGKTWGISVAELTEEANPTHNFIWEPISKGNGVSQTHSPDRDVESDIVKHDAEGVAAEGWLASPGYCVNGALFTNNCVK